MLELCLQCCLLESTESGTQVAFRSAAVDVPGGMCHHCTCHLLQPCWNVQSTIFVGLQVKFDGAALDAGRIADAVTAAGFPATVRSSQPDAGLLAVARLQASTGHCLYRN